LISTYRCLARTRLAGRIPLVTALLLLFLGQSLAGLALGATGFVDRVLSRHFLGLTGRIGVGLQAALLGLFQFALLAQSLTLGFALGLQLFEFGVLNGGLWFELGEKCGLGGFLGLQTIVNAGVLEVTHRQADSFLGCRYGIQPSQPRSAQ